jgi:hypothetical protein
LYAQRESVHVWHALCGTQYTCAGECVSSA